MDDIAYRHGRFQRRFNHLRSMNPYGCVMTGLLPVAWRTSALLSWAAGWDDVDAELAMEMS